MFKANNTIQNFFSYKDKIDKDLRSNIIYTVQCLDCKKNYIGKCVRLFSIIYGIFKKQKMSGFVRVKVLPNEQHNALEKSNAGEKKASINTGT